MFDKMSRLEVTEAPILPLELLRKVAERFGFNISKLELNYEPGSRYGWGVLEAKVDFERYGGVMPGIASVSCFDDGIVRGYKYMYHGPVIELEGRRGVMVSVNYEAKVFNKHESESWSVIQEKGRPDWFPPL